MPRPPASHVLPDREDRDALTPGQGIAKAAVTGPVPALSLVPGRSGAAGEVNNDRPPVHDAHALHTVPGDLEQPTGRSLGGSRD